MKKIRIILPIILSMIILINLTSCLVFVKDGKGRHNGWYKNPHNPHNPFKLNPNNNGNGNGHGNGHHNK